MTTRPIAKAVRITEIPNDALRAGATLKHTDTQVMRMFKKLPELAEVWNWTIANSVGATVQTDESEDPGFARDVLTIRNLLIFEFPTNELAAEFEDKFPGKVLV